MASRHNLSNDAVRIMLKGDSSVDFPEAPLVVRLVARPNDNGDDVHNDIDGGDQSSSSSLSTTGSPVWVIDATSRARARLIGSAAHNTTPTTLPCLAIVRGYVSSEVNPGNPHPILFLCTIDVLSSNASSALDKPELKLPASRIPGGRVYEFLTGMAHFLSNPDLAKVNCDTVSQFLEHAKAVQTLESSSFDDSRTTMLDNDGETNHDAPLLHQHLTPRTAFARSLQEFTRAQLERQDASLTAHLTRHPDQRDRIVDQHRDTLQAALQYGAQPSHPPLTVPVLCEWHRLLCHELHPSAGNLRTGGVRVGHTAFRHVRQVRKDLERTCHALAALEARFRTDSTLTPGYKAAVSGALTFFAIVDSHAFADGNGRLARAASNFALKRFGFDFPVQWFATPAQRKEYTQATIRTRRNLYLLTRGHVEQETLVQAYQLAGAVTPLVQLLVDRMSKAVGELTKTVQDKQRAVQQQVQERAARSFRERAAQDNCFICFEDKPNVSTLCCGKVAHLNCLAEWLVTKNTCPNCRGDLPALPQRLLRPQTNNNNNNLEDNGSANSTSSTTSSSVGNDDGDDGDTSSTVEDQVETFPMNVLRQAWLEQQVAQAIQGFSNGNHDDNDTNSTTTSDDDIGIAQRAAPTVQPVPDDDHTMSDDNDDTTSTDTEEEVVAPVNAHHHIQTEDDTTTDDNDTTEVDDTCAFCNNKAARDCDNKCCGRCCHSFGHYQCARHEQ